MKTKIAIAVILVFTGGLLLGWEIGGDSKPPEMVPVLVAAVKLRPGTILDQPEIQLAFKDYPEDRLPPEAMTDLNAVRDQVVVQSLRKGQPCTPANLVPIDVTFPAPPGMRAFLVRVKFESGLSGFLRPGDRIDLIRFYSEQGSNHVIAETFLDYVLVLGVWGPVVSIALPPEDVPTMISAKEKGTSYLTLSRPGEGVHEP